MRRPSRALTALALPLLTIASLCVSAAPVFAGSPPSNDDFEHAQRVATLPATISEELTDASFQTGEPPSTCTGAGGTPSVWFSIKRSKAGDLLVDLNGTAFPAVIAVWKGSSLATLREVECARDTTFSSEGRRARVAFHAVAGTRYYLQIYSQNGSAALIHGVVKTTHLPSNDAVANAKAITIPFSKTVSNVRATMQPGEPRDAACDGTRGTIWYRVRVAHAATLRADTFGSALDTYVAVYSGGPSIGSLHVVGCDDETSLGNQGTSQSSVAWHAKANKTYWIQIGGYKNDWGSIDLHVRKVSSPANDNLGAATQIQSLDGGPYQAHLSLRNATWQQGETVDSACTLLPRGHDSAPLSSVWYRYLAESTDPLQFVADGDLGVVPVVSVYTGSSFGSQQLFACASVDSDLQRASLTFTPENGETYWIQVAGEVGTTGPLRVSLAFAPEPG